MIAELKKVINVWTDVKDVFSIPKNEKNYKKLVKIQDELLDQIGENEKHPLVPLLETIGSLIENYEAENVMIPDSDPIEVLKYLMDEHNLTQKDLNIIGSQGVVSEILNHKRQLNSRQIKELSKKFNVSPAIFI